MWSGESANPLHDSDSTQSFHLLRVSCTEMYRINAVISYSRIEATLGAVAPLTIELLGRQFSKRHHPRCNGFWAGDLGANMAEIKVGSLGGAC